MKLWSALIVAAAGLAAVGCSSRATAAPAQIIFLRHAEKPPTGPELNARGEERAKALAALFAHDPRVREHGPAAAIFAMKPTGKHGTVRAMQTMEATGRALGIPVEAEFTRDEIAPLIRAILNAPALDGQTVVVCWEHNVIPEMLQGFGWTEGPRKWPGDAYDRLWVLDFAQSKPTRFRDLPQKLLPGDSAK